MVQKCLFMGLLLNDTSVIHKPKLIPGGLEEEWRASLSKTFHIQVGNYGAYQKPFHHSLNLLIEYVLKGEVCIMQTEPYKFNDVLY